MRANKGESRCLHSNQNLGRKVGAPLEDDGERTEEGWGSVKGIRGARDRHLIREEAIARGCDKRLP